MNEATEATYCDDSADLAGGRVPGLDSPAFRLWGSREPSIPVLVAAPHGGRAYSPSTIEAMRNADYARLRLEDRHVDALAREVARQTGAALLVAEAPRAVLDLNRAPDDVDWEMVTGAKPAKVRHSLSNRRARSGLGLVPRRLPGMGEIWRQRLTSAELKERIEGIHKPYHSALSSAVERMRDRWGAALLVDLHSMPPLKRKYPDERPAEFVIGDRFGAACDDRLTDASLRFLAGAGRQVAHNRPYSGGYVLERHSAPVRGLHAMQVEVCRTIYLDSRLVEPSARLGAIAKLLAGLVKGLANEVLQIGREGSLPQAAE